MCQPFGLYQHFGQRRIIRAPRRPIARFLARLVRHYNQPGVAHPAQSGRAQNLATRHGLDPKLFDGFVNQKFSRLLADAVGIEISVGL
jgi:hypothetical protein